MLDKLVCDPDAKAPDGTDYNDPPIGMRRITEKEFVEGQFFTYPIASMEYRQIFVKSKDDLTKGNGLLLSVRIFWFDDGTGLIMHGDYHGSGKVEYFACGCKHEYEGLSQQECHKRGIYHGGRCYFVAQCRKCHHIDAHDSSD